jgi:hypothetical protein
VRPIRAGQREFAAQLEGQGWIAARQLGFGSHQRQALNACTAGVVEQIVEADPESTGENLRRAHGDLALTALELADEALGEVIPGELRLSETARLAQSPQPDGQ